MFGWEIGGEINTLVSKAFMTQIKNQMDILILICGKCGLMI